MIGLLQSPRVCVLCAFSVIYYGVVHLALVRDSANWNTLSPTELMNNSKNWKVAISVD